MPTPGITFTTSVQDPELFGEVFPATSWQAWTAFGKAVFGEPMTAKEHAIFQQCTRRQAPPDGGAREAYAVVGRRGGKTRFAAAVAVYMACFRPYAPLLAPGERPTIMLIAADRDQARVLLGYIRGLLASTAVCHALVEANLQDEILLKTGVIIKVQTARYQTVRGYTVI